MQEIIEYFNSLEHKPLHRLAFMAVPIFLLWMLENGFPLIKMRYKKSKWRHAGINFSFTLVHLVFHALLAVFIVLASEWCRINDFGVVNWLNLPTGLVLVAGILSMDFFGGWLVHIVQHKVPLFWRMHVVHHADNNVDVSSGLRHHPFEALFRWVFFLLGIMIMGLPIWAVMIAQTFMSIFTMFTHANIRLPSKLDHVLTYIFISPNMHKVHHHWKQPFTDSNYGAVFSIWDRLLGTFSFLDTKELKYGLDRYYPAQKDEDVIGLLTSPFKKQDNSIMNS